MPKTTIMLYLNEKDFKKYSKQKKDLNNKARDVIRKELRRIK